MSPAGLVAAATVQEPPALLSRIALVGPMGIGKTTAVHTLCGAAMVSTDVPNLDKQAHHKEWTTVGAEFGEIDLGGGERVQLCGCPGQERFSFLRQWVLSVSVGVFVMVDVNDPSSLPLALQLLQEAAQAPSSPLPLVLSTRPATPAQIDAFGEALAARTQALVPVLPVDVRERTQMLDVLSVLVSMLSMRVQGA